MRGLKVYNSYNSTKEDFISIVKDKVGMYVCGPTLYSEPHLGNLRSFIHFDVIYRYLKNLGYQVKYVRNITDCGHITNSLGNDVDNIGIESKLQQKEPLELVYFYNRKFQKLCELFNLLPPAIEPTATAHIQEQIDTIEKIISNGFAYIVNGSVYFDVKKYSEIHDYGKLSGRKLDELIEESRDLNSQTEKRYFADFALWKKANPEDMQIWKSPWGNGNPGWHIECTAMSTKYLGISFDIHGGGMDLKATHHEAEIAQNMSSVGVNSAKYWLHTNMLNVNGKKMSKSLGNSFLPQDLIDGTTKIFSKPFSPNSIRFFILTSHYRSELDITEEGLISSEKALNKIIQTYLSIDNIPILEFNKDVDNQLKSINKSCIDSMNDDFNTAKLIAQLSELNTLTNKAINKMVSIDKSNIESIKNIYETYMQDILGIVLEKKETINSDNELIDLIVDLRKKARDAKDFSTSDYIRDQMSKLGIELQDKK